MHVTAYRYEFDLDMDSLVSERAVRAAVENETYDLANPLNSPKDVIRDTGLRMERNFLSDYREFRTVLDGGGEAAWAAGLELASDRRRNRIEFLNRSGGRHAAGDVMGVLGSGDVTEFDVERRRASAFAELRLPIAAAWDAVGRRL